MSNILRRDPFDSTFEPVLRAWLQPVQLRKDEYSAIKLDVSANNGAYIVSAEIPGVAKDQIEVAIEQNVVTVSAEIKDATSDTEGARKILTERVFGKFARSITLTDEIDADAATARHVDGVLYLTLPKKASTAGRRLAIQ